MELIHKQFSANLTHQKTINCIRYFYFILQQLFILDFKFYLNHPTIKSIQKFLEQENDKIELSIKKELKKLLKFKKRHEYTYKIKVKYFILQAKWSIGGSKIG